MTTKIFFLEGMIQTLVIANVGLLLSLLTKKFGEDSSVDLISKVIYWTALGLTGVAALIVVGCSIFAPEMARPIRTPIDLFLLKEDLSPKWGVAASLLMMVFLVSPICTYLWKVLLSQKKERKSGEHLRTRCGTANRYLAKERKRNSRLEAGIKFIKTSQEVPDSVKVRLMEIVSGDETGCH